MGHGSGGFTAPATVETKPGDPAGELYDMRKDPGETHDLYKERPEVVARLTKLLERDHEGRSCPA